MRTNDKDTNGIMEKIARLEEKLIASDQALNLARESMEHWKSGSNEWRAALDDQRNLFLTIDKAASLIALEASQRAALEGRIYVLEKSANIGVGKETGVSSLLGTMVTIVSLIMAFAALAINFLRK